MADPTENSADSPSNDADSSDDLGPIGRVHELAWTLLDEHISDAEMAELETFLRDDKEARDAYVRCVQMHVDLTHHFSPEAVPQFTPPAAKTPVLGMLAEGLPQMGTPTVGDATT